jgi:hypothetical protein
MFIASARRALRVGKSLRQNEIFSRCLPRLKPRYHAPMTDIRTRDDCWTPDRRYLVIRGRLWRLSSPFLDPEEHAKLVRDLMSARRAVLGARDSRERMAARQRVDSAKRALGERGEVWWKDGSPDYNRRLVQNSPYAAWFASRSRAPASAAHA